MAYASGGGSSVQSVVIGDLNNDTNLDIVLANYGTNNIGVLVGYGNGSFENQMMFSTGANSHPISIAIGDFNGDRVVDIAVANHGTKHVDMMLGNENGEFAMQTSYEIGFDSPPIVMAAGDFNNDKQSEIVIANGGSNHLDIFVAYNHGSFEDQKRYSVGSYPRSVVVGDFNNDSRLDIVVANWNSNDVSVLLGVGNGSFENEISYSAGSSPQSVVVGDLNNDRRLDIVVANWNSNDVSVLLGVGNGSFENQIRYSVGYYPGSVVVGDFNNDSRLDIVVANWGNNDVSVLLGNGNGSFEDQKRYSAGSYPRSVTVGDFNNDSRLDIVVANEISNDVSVLLGVENGSFENQRKYSAGMGPQSVVVDNFNNDTRLDIIVVNWGSHDVSVLLGNGNGSFENEIRYAVGFYPESVVVGDFNNDTRLDIVVTNSKSNDVSVLLGNGNGSFENQTRYSVGSYPRSVVVGDFNNDTRLDIVVTNSNSNDMSVLLGYKNIVFVKQMILITGNDSRPQSLVISDFNNDGLMDIGVVNSLTHNIGIFLGYGNISFTNQVIYSTDPYLSPCSLAVGDFNNDTRVDIAFGSCHSNNVGILLGCGNGSFGDLMAYSTGSNSSRYSLAVSDINNDTIQDIIVANHDANYLGVLLGHGNGTFASIILFPLDYGSNPFSIVVGDFNNDRKLDIAVANSGTDSLNILLQTC
ncbi:unnamed protein product [Rotaria sp. Silwood1]|nr:unnamed protein product [Rotaria sp. Silwood1]CAF5113088.1 unnamed protein product [Rotaria sp. Silwood1]